MTPEHDHTGPASAGPFFDAVARAVQVACASVLAALVMLVCLEAFLRGAFTYSLGFAEELTGYGVVFMTFFGAALSLRRGSMFQVHFLLDRLPQDARHLVVRVFAAVALILCILLAWKTKDVMLSSFARGKFAPTVLHTPLWIPQLILPAGFGVLGVFLIEKLVLTFRRTWGQS